MAEFKVNGFTPAESVFAPTKAGKHPETPAAPKARTLVMGGGDEQVVVRGVLAESESGIWSVTLAHEYEGVPFVGLNFEADGKLFEVVERAGRTLTLEVA